MADPLWDSPDDVPDGAGHLDAIRHETELLDVGGFAADMEHAGVLRYVRMRTRLEHEIQMIRENAEAMCGQLQHRINSLDYCYRAFAQQWAEKQVRGKPVRSIRTPFGVLGFRRVPESLAVIDELAVLAAVERGELPSDCRRIKAELSRSAIAKIFLDTGEIPAGCVVQPARETFYVRPGV